MSKIKKSKPRRKSCKKGSVRNRKTGRCRSKSKTHKKTKSRRKSCKKGSVRNRKTGICRSFKKSKFKSKKNKNDYGKRNYGEINVSEKEVVFNIEEKSNGIFQINVKHFPEYPIAYIRLCYDDKKSSYCILEECDISKIYKKHRKIIVVGMRLPEISKDKIYEQVFYLSSGSNSIESLEKLFKTKFKNENENDNENIWLPFSGFGYNYRDLETENDLETKIKLLKNYFGHGCGEISSNCLYGRFGDYEPNLMQISYCLGGDFWKNNIDNFIFDKYEIEKYPMIPKILEKLQCVFSNENFSNNIECSVYLNNYIGSAISINYSPELLRFKMQACKAYIRFPIRDLSYYDDIDYDDIDYDYRIVNILYNNNIYLFEKKGVKSHFPFENTFGTNITWLNYFNGIYKIFKNNFELFEAEILPIITDKRNAI